MLLNASDLKINTASENTISGSFVFEPLPTGFGNTVGNALRRVLLTALEGAAVTSIKISGADHQFTTIEGVKEDIVEMTMNFKKVRFNMHSENPVIATINKKGAGPVTAGDIEVSSEVEVLNKDLVLATLTDKNATLKVELVIEKGTGYSPMEERQNNKIGMIVLDALFSPVTEVSYKVEATRSGKIVNLDKLVLNVNTDGSVSPKEAVLTASDILETYFKKISMWEAPSAEGESTEEAEEGVKTNKPTENINVEELPLPTRTVNALKKQGINSLAQLAAKSDDELSEIKNLGEKSVLEIKKLLKKEGFR